MLEGDRWLTQTLLTQKAQCSQPEAEISVRSPSLGLGLPETGKPETGRGEPWAGSVLLRTSDFTHA